MNFEHVLNLMVLARDGYYDKLIEIEKELEIMEKYPNLFNMASLLLVIEKEKYNEKIEEATKTIDAFKKEHNIY